MTGVIWALFSVFGGFDDQTKAQLKHGSALMQLLKQPLCKPLSLHEQVITLVLANHKFFDIFDTNKVKEAQADVLSYLDSTHGTIGERIESQQALNDEIVSDILAAAEEYKKSRNLVEAEV